MWNQTFPIPGNGAKIWSGENRARKVYVLKSRFKVCVLWLTRYFRCNIEAKRVESTGMGSDRSFTGWFMCVLMVLQYLKEWKEKKIKNEKRSTVKHKEVGNIKKNIFVVFGFSKIKWKGKKTHSY